MPDALSWLDLVVATPTVGISWRSTFRHWTEYLPAIKPILERWRAQNVGAQVATPANEPMMAKLSDDRGFNVTLMPNGLVVEFKYPVGIEEPEGKVAAIRAGAPERFSALLEQVVQMSEEFGGALVDLEGKTGVDVDRFGIVAAVRLGTKLLPPGVAAVLKTLGSPWKNGLRTLQGTLLVTLSEEETRLDQCHHFFNYDRGREEMALKLDWQTVRSPAIRYLKPQLAKELRSTVSNATAYFEGFGAGGP